MYFYLHNKKTDRYARHDSLGEHDGRVTTALALALRFESWREASEYAQNFGPDWEIEVL